MVHYYPYQIILWSLVSDLYFPGSHRNLNVWLCLRLLMSWRTPPSPTELSIRWSFSSDVFCCNMSDIEEAPFTPIGLRFRSRSCRVEFLQSADARSLAPCPLMWQSSNTKLVNVHFVLSLSIDDKLSTFAMLK